MGKTAVAVLVAGAIGMGSVALLAEEPPQLSVEWVFSEGGKNATRMPRYAWRGQAELLLLDETRPAEERVLERYVAGSRKRTPAFDRAQARLGLENLVGKAAMPEALPWPEDVDQTGRLALHLVADDLFVLDLASSRFTRLTCTPQAEALGRFSPDGRRVAFVRENDLYVVDVATGAERRLTTDGSTVVLNGVLSWVYGEEIFDHEAPGFWWSPDSAALAFLRSDESNVSEIVFPGLEPAVPGVTRQRYPKAGGANPDVEVGIVEVASGRTAFVPRRAMPYEYVLGVAWRPDSQKIAVQVTNRTQTRCDLYLAERSGDEATLALSDPDEAWINQHELQFLSDGRFVWTSERDGYTHLYLHDATGGLIAPLTGGDWSVRGSGAFYAEALGSVWLDEQGGLVYFTALEKGVTERHLYRVRLDGSGLERLTQDDGVHSVAMDATRRYWVDLHSAHCQPPTLTVRDARSEGADQLAHSRDGLLVVLDWQCPELLTVPAEDATPLHVRVIRPKPFEEGRRYPAIVFVYGGPSAPLVRDSFNYSFARNALFDQILSRRGYVVMNVDPRSATAGSKTVENAVADRIWSDVELADILAGVSWLKSQSYVDGERVGVWGWSGGGTSTLLLMTRSTEFKAGIAVAPVTDWRYYDTKFTEAFMKAPADNPEGYAHTSLVARAKDLHGRVMLVHGTHDDNVHPQNTWAMVDALIAAGKRFDVMVYPLRKHPIKDDPARIDLFKRMLEFWERNLGAVGSRE